MNTPCAHPGAPQSTKPTPTLAAQPSTSLAGSGGAPLIGLSSIPFLPRIQKTGSRSKEVVFELRQNSGRTFRPGGARSGADRTEAQQRTAVANLASQQQKGSTKGTGFMSAKAAAGPKKNVHRILSMASAPAAKEKRYNDKLGYAQQLCYPTFLTTTLPSDQHRLADGSFDDAGFKVMLGRFMEDVCKICGVEHYQWVVEPQEVTQNLHSHSLVDKFIENLPAGQNKVDLQPLRLTKLWNAHLRREGYIEPYAAKMRAKYADGFAYDPDMADLRKEWDGSDYIDVSVPVPEAKQRERHAYGVATDWQEPNTVDIHALASKENVAGYIAAYMTKNKGVRPIKGRLSGHSKGLEKIPLYQEPYSDDLRDTVAEMQAQGKAKELLITPEGKFTRQEYDDNDLAAARVPVFLTVFSWKDADFFRAAPPGYVRRHNYHWRDVVRREYGAAKMPALRAHRAPSRPPLPAAMGGRAQLHQPGRAVALA